MNKINIIAHRGIYNNKNIPENSLLAFKLALDYNMPIELDLQLTKDNILVVLHDFDLYRMTKTKKKVQDTLYQDIRSLTLLETNEKIPTLQDVLKLIDGKVLLDLEIKDTKRVKDTCDIFLKEMENYNGDFTIKSFNPKIINYFKHHKPEVIRGLLITNHYDNILFNLFIKSNLILKYCKPNFLSISKKLLKSKKWQKLARKYPTQVWSIDNKKEINDIDNQNLVYICNNLPY